MDRTIIDVPARWFGMTTHDLHLDVRGRSAGEGVTGNGQVVYGLMPRWVMSLDTRVLEPVRGRAWRALIASLRGRVNVLRIQLVDPLRPGFTDLGLSDADVALLAAGLLPHSDDTLFDDGAGYTQSPSAPLRASAAAGATTLAIAGGALGSAPIVGCWFTVNAWLHQVTAIEGTGDDTVVTIEPPLRAAASADAELDFDPWALMVLTDDLQGRLKTSVPHFSSGQVSLVEWTNR